MLKIAICDDDEEERKKLLEYIERYSIQYDCETYTDHFSNGKQLVNVYEKGKYDIVILDVEMEEMDGLETGRYIRNIPDHDVVIMYASSHPEYMQASFNVRAAQYMTKPYSYDSFVEKIQNVVEYKKVERETIIKLSTRYDDFFISESDLVYFSLERRGVISVRTTTKTVRVNGTISELLEKYNYFLVQIARNTLVNLRYIYKVSENKIELKTGEVFTITREKREEISRRFNKYIIERLVNDTKTN